MSGGDGKGHNSGAHATGGVNGTSGKGGPAGGNNTHETRPSTSGYHGDMTIHGSDGSSHTTTFTGGGNTHTGNGNGGGSGHGSGGNNHTGTTAPPTWNAIPGKPGSFTPPQGEKYRGSGFKSLDVRSVNGIGTYTIHLSSGGIMTVTVKNGDLNNMDVQFSHWHGSKSRERLFAKEIVTDYVNYEKVVSITVDFYKELTSKFGDKFSKEAQSLAEDAKGKTLKNAKDAIKAFDKYKDVLNKKFSVADRETIAKALESLSKDEMAKQLAQFSKAFGLVSSLIQWNSFRVGLVKGFRTGNWNDAIIGGESIIAGKIASALVAAAFSMMAVNPIGILGYAMIMAVTSALITDKKLQEMNDFIMSL